MPCTNSGLCATIYFISAFTGMSLNQVITVSSVECSCTRPSSASLVNWHNSKMWFTVCACPHELHVVDHLYTLTLSRLKTVHHGPQIAGAVRTWWLDSWGLGDHQVSLHSVLARLTGSCQTILVCIGGARHGLRGLNLQKCGLAPNVKHTGQEPGGELYEIFKFWSFLQSKSVNYLQTASASWGLCPQTPRWGLPSLHI